MFKFPGIFSPNLPSEMLCGGKRPKPHLTASCRCLNFKSCRIAGTSWGLTYGILRFTCCSEISFRYLTYFCSSFFVEAQFLRYSKGSWNCSCSNIASKSRLVYWSSSNFLSSLGCTRISFFRSLVLSSIFKAGNFRRSSAGFIRQSSHNRFVRFLPIAATTCEKNSFSTSSIRALHSEAQEVMCTAYSHSGCSRYLYIFINFRKFVPLFGTLSSLSWYTAILAFQIRSTAFNFVTPDAFMEIPRYSTSSALPRGCSASVNVEFATNEYTFIYKI